MISLYLVKSRRLLVTLFIIFFAVLTIGCANKEPVGVPPIEAYTSGDTINNLMVAYKEAMGKEYYECFEFSKEEHISILTESSEYCARYSFDALPRQVESSVYQDASEDYSVCLMHLYFSRLKPRFKTGYKRATSCYKTGATLKVLDGSHPALSYLEQSGIDSYWIDKYQDYATEPDITSKQMKAAEHESSLIADTLAELNALNIELGDHAENIQSAYGEPKRRIEQSKFAIWLYPNDMAFVFGGQNELERVAFCEGCSKKLTRGSQRYKQQGMSDRLIIDLLFPN
jgi:hypothetical protein